MSNGIHFPFRVDGEGASITQMQEVYRYVDEIIDCLDDHALNELLSGSQEDVDNLSTILMEESYNTMYGKLSGPIQTGSFGYMDKLSQSIDDTLCTLSFAYFILAKLPTFELGWHVIEWCQMVQLYKWLSIIAARDHSKSYTFSFAYPLWLAWKYAKGTTDKPVRRELSYGREILLITNEYGLAKHHLAKVKEEVEVNSLLDRLKPKSRDGWAKESLVFGTGAKMYIKTYGSSMRGFHPTSTIIDDFMNDSVMYSADQREKYFDYLNSVIMNAASPGTPVTNIGTPFHQDDVFGRLKSSSAWKTFEYPAIMPDGTLLYENRHNLESLLEKKESQGSIIFSREILVRPVSSASTIFPPQMVNRAFHGMEHFTLVKNRMSHPMKFERVAVGCDFAASGNVGADFSVFITLGATADGKIWLINLWRGKGKTYNQQLSALKHINVNFNPDVIYAESNQMQTLFVSGGKEMGMPVIGDHTGVNKYDLKSGLPGMVVLFEQDRFCFPRGDAASVETTDLVTGELSSVSWSQKGKLESVGQHDDTVMALWKAVRALNHVGNSFNVSWM